MPTRDKIYSAHIALLSIVAIVAIVGIVVLVKYSYESKGGAIGTTVRTAQENGNLVGQAYQDYKDIPQWVLACVDKCRGYENYAECFRACADGYRFITE